MSDQERDDDQPVDETPAEETASGALPPGRDRPDPRLRPPDPAGTQPTWDPDALLPKETPRAAAGRLWATAAEGEDEGGDAAGEAGGATATAYASATAAPEAPAAAAPGAAGAPAEAAEDDDPRYSRYSARFQFLLGALLAVGAAAIALLVAVLAGGGQTDTKLLVKSGPNWSEWRPTATGGVHAAEQIAKHVGAQYKLANGKQLVLVTGGALEVEQIPVTIAIQQPAAQGGSVDLLDDGAGVMYRLNGVGTQDGHLPGTPSRARHLLLRREALELALYSFRYLGVSETVVLFPPTSDQNTGAASASGLTTTTTQAKALPTALLFRRDQADVQAALAQPLKATLSKETPSVKGVSRASDARTVSAITNDKVYTYKLQQANTDLRLFLVLNPIRLR